MHCRENTHCTLERERVGVGALGGPTDVSFLIDLVDLCLLISESVAQNLLLIVSACRISFVACQSLQSFPSFPLPLPRAVAVVLVCLFSVYASLSFIISRGAVGNCPPWALLSSGLVCSYKMESARRKWQFQSPK